MNYPSESRANEIPAFQVREFQKLMADMVQCCKERSQFQAERFGLPEAELRCLMLFGEERYLTPKNMARRMNVAKSRISKIAAGLVKRGLVRRSADPEDSRVALLSLSPEGQRILDQVTAYTRDISRAILDAVPAERRAAILDSLGALRTSMETVKDLLE